MPNLLEKIETSLKAKSLNEIIKHSEERYKPKIFAEKYLSIYKSIPIVRIVFSLFSIVTGICFFVSISESLPIYLSVLLGCLLYVLLEVIKGKILSISLTEIFSKQLNIISIFSLPLALLLFVVSVFCSVQGIETFYNHIDKAEDTIKASYSLKLDSINTYYQTEIKANEQAKNKYIESVSYKGKLNIHNKTNKQLLSSYDSRLNTLIEDHKQASLKAEAEQASKAEQAEQTSTFNIDIWIIISVSIELSIMLCLVFQAYYLFKVFNERQAQEESSYFTSQFKPAMPGENSTFLNNSIGFQLPLENKSDNTMKASLEDRKQVLDILINSGIQDMKILSKLGFNFKQLAEAINSK